ncbi:MAG: hypothetical protein MUE94_07900 [Verrucomicrobia bacterium]|nr:hypothetical protein [Verrucomicrobiota bacterium]
MWRTFLILWIAGAVLARAGSGAVEPPPAEGRIKKVLPHLFDARSQHTVSPSLFDRDAYQALLRGHPERVTGIGYDVRWTARYAGERPLTVRLELLGIYEGKVPRQRLIEQTFSGRSSWRQWTRLELRGADYKEFGKITAWRVTLWAGDEMLDEYKSFLW